MPGDVCVSYCVPGDVCVSYCVPGDVCSWNLNWSHCVLLMLPNFILRYVYIFDRVLCSRQSEMMELSGAQLYMEREMQQLRKQTAELRKLALVRQRNGGPASVPSSEDPLEADVSGIENETDATDGANQNIEEISNGTQDANGNVTIEGNAVPPEDMYSKGNKNIPVDISTQTAVSMISSESGEGSVAVQGEEQALVAAEGDDHKQFCDSYSQTDVTLSNCSVTDKALDIDRRDFTTSDCQTETVQKDYTTSDCQTETVQKDFTTSDCQTETVQKYYFTIDCQTDPKEYSVSDCQTDFIKYSTSDCQTEQADTKDCSTKDSQTDPLMDSASVPNVPTSDSAVVAAALKKTMNAVYKATKTRFDVSANYQGDTIRDTLLTVIKVMITGL